MSKMFPDSTRRSPKRDLAFSSLVGLGRVPNVGLADDIAPPNPLIPPPDVPTGFPDKPFDLGPSLPPSEGTAIPEPAAVIGTVTTKNSDFDAQGCLKSGTGTNSPMKSLQSRLNALGYKGADGKPLVVDGLMGANTRAAVRAFQKDHGLVIDGCPGSNTLVAIQHASAGASGAPIPATQTGPGAKPATAPPTLPAKPATPPAKPATASSDMSSWLLGGALAVGAGAGLYYFNKKRRVHAR